MGGDDDGDFLFLRDDVLEYLYSSNRRSKLKTINRVSAAKSIEIYGVDHLVVFLVARTYDEL